MPWLTKDADDPSKQLFFVHVPRCGGTSLMQHFDVPQKCLQGRNVWRKFGMRTFFHRYRLLESANFPYKTRANLLFLTLLIASIVLLVFKYYIYGGLGILVSVVFSTSLTFIFTAPVIGRIAPVRHFFLLLIDKVLCRYMESVEWMTGTNKHGYMMHLPAQKCLHYGYITSEEFSQANTMAIVRNPYARMVSIYMYNRYGKSESFAHFMQDWYRVWQPYRQAKERGEPAGLVEEWYLPCHAIPQFEYTHADGKQLVQSVVKQEELKFLTVKDGEHLIEDSTIKDLPTPVRDALLGMPHTNKRETDRQWYDYYDQTTLNLCFEMYEEDFDVFNYRVKLEQRPDLMQPPHLDGSNLQRMSRNSILLSADLQAARRSSILRMVGNAKESSSLQTV
jgi:hypothetical protein